MNFRSKFARLFCALFLSAFAPQPHAAAAEQTLGALLKEAEQNNPRLQAAKREAEAARRRVVQSWALEDPMFGFAAGDMMIEDVETRVGPQMERYEISQAIPFPLKLVQKYRMAAAEARAAEKEYEAERRDVASELKKAYFELNWIDASLLVAYEVKGILQNAQSVAQARYSSGKGGQRDVAKALVDLSMIYDKIYMFEQQRKTKIAELNRLLNRRASQDETDFQAGLNPPALKRNLPELLAAASQARPEILKMRHEEKKEKEGVKLAALGYAPDLKLDYEYIAVGGGETDDPEDGKDAKMVMLEFTVPLWLQKNNARIAESHQTWRAAQARLGEERVKAQYEVKDAFARYEAAMQLVNLYKSSALPQAKLALESDQSGYEAGTGDFLNLLDSERMYLDAELSYLKATLEALTAMADLERAAGIDFTQEEWGLMASAGVEK